MGHFTIIEEFLKTQGKEKGVLPICVMSLLAKLVNSNLAFVVLSPIAKAQVGGRIVRKDSLRESFMTLGERSIIMYRDAIFIKLNQ